MRATVERDTQTEPIAPADYERKSLTPFSGFKKPPAALNNPLMNSNQH